MFPATSTFLNENHPDLTPDFAPALVNCMSALERGLVMDHWFRADAAMEEANQLLIDREMDARVAVAIERCYWSPPPHGAVARIGEVEATVTVRQSSRVLAYRDVIVDASLGEALRRAFQPMRIAANVEAFLMLPQKVGRALWPEGWK